MQRGRGQRLQLYRIQLGESSRGFTRMSGWPSSPSRARRMSQKQEKKNKETKLCTVTEAHRLLFTPSSPPKQPHLRECDIFHSGFPPALGNIVLLRLERGKKKRTKQRLNESLDK